MKLGLGSYTYRWSIGHKGVRRATPMTAFDVLDVAAGKRLGIVQFADNLPLAGLGKSDLDALARRAKAESISLEVGMQGFDGAELERYLSICGVLDAGILRIALDAEEAGRGVSELAAEFTRLLKKARDHGVCIAIENHFNYPSRQLAHLVETIGDPSVGVCLDVANSICAGEWPAETVGVLAPHAINLHLKDYIIDPDPFGVGFRVVGVPLGQGKTDCASVLNALGHDRNVSVILEHWLPLSDDLDAACASEHEWLDESVTYARRELDLH